MIVSRNSSRTRQNSRKQQVKPEGKPDEIDFSRYIKDWAAKYGFNAQQAREEIDKWITDVEKNQNDLYKLGLAAFAKKNFGEASVLFNESAELKAKKLEAVRQQEKTLTDEVVRDFRLTGDAHYNNYAFDQALQAYQRALATLPKNKHPNRGLPPCSILVGRIRNSGFALPGWIFIQVFDCRSAGV